MTSECGLVGELSSSLVGAVFVVFSQYSGLQALDKHSINSAPGEPLHSFGQRPSQHTRPDSSDYLAPHTLDEVYWDRSSLKLWGAMARQEHEQEHFIFVIISILSFLGAGDVKRGSRRARVQHSFSVCCFSVYICAECGQDTSLTNPDVVKPVLSDYTISWVCSHLASHER